MLPPAFALTRSQFRAVLSGALALAVLIVALVSVDRWVLRSAADEAKRVAKIRTEANAGLFSSELQKYRLLPLVLAENTDVLEMLRSNRPEIARQLNAKLKSLALHTGTAAIYVLDGKGTTLASSNYDQPTSFVGHNYVFRTYFSRALKDGSGEYFALGTITRRPGLYLSQRVGKQDGVVVAKIEFDKLETVWAQQPGSTLIRNHSGVVTVASDPHWLLRASRPLPRDPLQESQRVLQFGAAIPPPLPFLLPPQRPESEIVSIDRPGRFAIASAPVPVRRWTLSTLEPLDPALKAAKTRALVLELTTALALVVVFGLLFRSMERRRLLLNSRRELEVQVTERTAELRSANDMLVKEVAERERTSRHLRKARDELAQANRLGSIGQITTGVAHEINQPVAAIRTFAESAKILVEQGDTVETSVNLDLIIDLTSRIGRITSELRAFARREAPVIGRVQVIDAIDGALLLMGDRMRGERVKLSKPQDAVAIYVMVDRIRLEQVIINLLQNALDAMADIEVPHILITLVGSADGKEIVLTVHDNGPGVAAAVRTTLFRPFVTDKQHGLGLGLGIAQDIVRDFGGELSVVQSALGGAAFAVTLVRG